MAFPTTILSHLRLQNWFHTVAYQDPLAILPASRKHHNFITIITCLFDVSWPLMASFHLIGLLCQVCCRLEGSQASCRDSFALVELGATPQEQLFHQLAMLSELVQAWTTHSPRKAMDAASTVPVLGTQTILATFGSAGTPKMFCLKIWVHKFILLYSLEFQYSSTFFTSHMHPNAESIKKDRKTCVGKSLAGLDHKWLDLCFWQFPVSTHGSALTPKLLHLSAAATSHVAPGRHPPHAPKHLKDAKTRQNHPRP